jgi:carboxypeptidase Q
MPLRLPLSRSRSLSPLLMLGGASLCLAQQPAPPPANSPLMQRMSAFLDVPNGSWTSDQITTMNRLRDAALTDPYAMNELRHLTDNIGPRLSGSPQAQHAVEFVAAEMRSLGADVQLEKTSVPHWVRGAETGELVAWPGMTPATTQKIVLTALGGSVATPADGLTAEVIVVNSFSDLKALSPDAVKGKILLFNEKFDKRLAAQGHGFEAYGQAVIYRATAPVIGAAHGAVAVLVRSVGGADFRLPHTGMTMYDPQSTKIPAAAVTAEDADLLAHLTSQGHVRMKLTLTPQTLPNADSYNVIADWKGTEHPEQVVIVSGHLDSWDLGTGAIDDGAGVVVSMQAIHLLSQLGIHPKRTIRFVAWMSEEEGSQGAQTYAQDHAADVPNHIGAIETDSGAGHPTGIYFSGKPALESWLRPVAQTLQPIGASELVSTPETGEDIATITTKGVPGFAPIQDSRFYFNYHHTAADTFDKVDGRELNENAAVVTVLAYALADASEAAPR